MHLVRDLNRIRPPTLRMPTAPIATSPLLAMTAQTRPGTWCSSRTGASILLMRSSARTGVVVVGLSPCLVRTVGLGQREAGPDRQPPAGRRKRNVASPDHYFFAR